MGLACYETATFNTTTCSWDVSGTQPAAPTGLACYETVTFNSSTCAWVVSGTQPTAPSGLACYEIATFNSSTCAWVVSGTQPAAPSGLACFETATFNTSTCSWVVSGTQPTISVNSESICEGSSATLTATVNPTGGIILWGNSQNTTSISVAPMITTSYSVLYNINGCYLTASGTVTVNPIPTLSISSETICNGETAIINATPSVSGGTFYWTLGGETTQSMTVNPNSTTIYSAIYTLNGCTSLNASGTVTVHPIPGVSVNDVSICEGENATLTATPSSIGGTYLWLPGGEINNSITISPNNSTSYSVLYTLNGCESTPATGTVFVNPIPSVSFSADVLSGCAPLTVNLSNNSGNSSICAWNIGNGQLVNGCETEYTFTQGGCYDISLTTTENGCSNSLTLYDYICVENPPTASFTTSPSSILEGVNFQTISTSNFSTGATNYTWELSNGQFSNETSPDFTLTNQNDGLGILLIAQGAFGCIDTQFVHISIQSENEVYVPNTFTPDNSELNDIFQPIYSQPSLIEEYELVIYNRWGDIIFESQDQSVGWNGFSILTNKIVQDGTYIYVIKYRSQNQIRKKIVGHITVIR
jgi:gliding motility-associated-like protein